MTSPLTDNELIEEFRRGNIDAFEMLVERYQAMLLNFFYHCARDRQTAEDCTQEVFIRLVSNIARYTPKAKFTTFLFRVARNLWIDRLRADGARLKPVSLEVPLMDSEKKLKETVPSASAAPPEILSRKEGEASIMKVIDELPEDVRIVLVLSELEGLKYKEISEVLDIPIGTVKSRMHNAVELLKKKWGDRDLDEEEE